MNKAIPRSVLERKLDAQGIVYAGVDEVGVSAIAGKLLAVAVILPKDVQIDGVRDSKLISQHKTRVQIAEEIKAKAIAVGYGWMEPAEVDKFNIFYASIRAMERAVADLKVNPEAVITDFHTLVDIEPGVVQYNIVKADRKVFAVAAASIVAKATRDTYMKALALEYPQYGWDTGVGYRTKKQWEAIRQYGLTPHHRKKYAVLRPEGGEDGAEREAGAVVPTDGSGE